MKISTRKRLKIMVILLLLLLLAAAWIASRYLYRVEHPDILYIGDSLCEATHDGKGASLAVIAAIAQDCKGGRKSLEYGVLPKGKRAIFYALGTNDKGHTPIDVYRTDLAAKIMAADAGAFYCVLPDTQNSDYQPYIQAMLDLCPATIDPRQHGYLYRARDGIHGSVEDHRQYGAWLKNFVQTLP